MVKELLARGQATITALSDAYTIVLSPAEYLFPATSAGEIPAAVTVSCEIQVTQGNTSVTAFTIGTPIKPSGFASISVDNATKWITFTVAGGTSSLADHGKIDIPVTVTGTTYHLWFVWSKAKAGMPGPSGADANMLDWVKEWNTGKTLIEGSMVITPKLFAGTKNADGTLTGTAIGRYAVITKSSSGSLKTETVEGISGFKNGEKTFFLDNGGNAQLGLGDQYVKYNAATGKVEFGPGVSVQWIGATYIDKNGVFTGTLSASTVSAVRINASQITAGKINAQYIDVASLKTTLITAGNIEALTLNVTRGKIGGWSVDTDSIYRGTKNNASGVYTTSSGAITLGSYGLRGYKWRLDATGSGALAGGNIAWDAAGNVTFGANVSVQWSAPLDGIIAALGGDAYPKLTKLTATGIYTGSLTAAQITSGTISADRIAAGSLKAEKLDAVSLKSSIINTDYINGLSCNFTKGYIGGWKIGASSLTDTHIALDNANRRVVVYGPNSGVTSGQRVQIYYNSDRDFGLYATNSAGACVLSLGSSNSIAGWSIGTTAITKNNISLGADGSITNGAQWKLNNDGSGQIAAGNISWDAAGAVTFASAVSLNWTAPISNITSALGGTSYPKLTKITAGGIYTGTLTASQVNAVSIDAASIRAGVLNADRIAAGSIDATKLDAESIRSSIINTDYISGLACRFTKGYIGGWNISKDGIDSELYCTYGGVAQIRLRSELSFSGNSWFYEGYPSAGLCILWTNVYTSGHLSFGEVANMDGTTKEGYLGLQMMDWDGNEYFCLSAPSDYTGEIDPYNRIAGWAFDQDHIWKNNISLGSDGSISNGSKWQLNNDGSGRIAAGNISWDASGNVTFTSAVSMAWSSGVDAITTALGGADYPKLTQITASGIYTGKISASQINVDSALVVGGSTSSGSISVRDAANNVKATLDRSGITAVSGKIGGWIINNETICAAAPASGHRIYLTSSGYIYNDNPNTGKDYWGLKPDGSATFGYGTTSFSKDGSGFLAGGNLSWDAAGNLIGKDATLEDIFMTGTFRSPFVAYDGSINIGGGSSEAELHDNLTMPGGGGWILSSDFPWDATQNGRTVTIVNYKYNGNITTGKMQLSAPTGKYFFEDGLLKSSILLSREYVLLKGYGEGTNFYGWIVMHRGDIGTVSKYGSCAKVMYQGWVENGVIKRYKSFDDGKPTCSRTATGTYQISFPSGVSIPINDYTVMVTGSNIVADTTNQVYASLTAKTTTHFVVKTADDSSRNNASFTFQVISMADWSN